MFKFTSWILSFFVILLIIITTNQHSIAESMTDRQALLISTVSKKELAKKLLTEINLEEQYNQYFSNGIDLMTGPNVNQNFTQWLQKTLAEKAGWKKVESKYIDRLTNNLSRTELQQLLATAKKPLTKKLLSAQIQAYQDTAVDRRKLLQQFWEDYNTGLINPPQN